MVKAPQSAPTSHLCISDSPSLVEEADASKGGKLHEARSAGKSLGISALDRLLGEGALN
jgi:hypothetical protein